MSSATVEFDDTTQALAPLQEAAYRFLKIGTCHISKTAAGFACLLEQNAGNAIGRDALRHHFLCLVTDENLRARVNADTADVRNLVLALAFGALANEQAGSGKVE